jgi:hypothetical protein
MGNVTNPRGVFFNFNVLLFINSLTITVRIINPKDKTPTTKDPTNPITKSWDLPNAVPVT